MMKKLSFLFAFLLTITFLSCKKKADEPAPAPTTTGSSTLNYYGLLNTVQFDYIVSGSVTPLGGVSNATFPTNGFINSATISEGTWGTNVNAGTISVNSVILKANTGISPGNTYYQDSTNTLFNSPLAWSVSGGNGIPAFNYTYTATRPSYSGYASMPDTIKLTQNNVFNLTGIVGADEIVITVSNSTAKMKVLSGTATSVSFSPSELNGLPASTSSGLIVSVNKYTIVNLGGKDFKFKIGYEIYKSIVIQ